MVCVTFVCNRGNESTCMSNYSRHCSSSGKAFHSCFLIFHAHIYLYSISTSTEHIILSICTLWNAEKLYAELALILPLKEKEKKASSLCPISISLYPTSATLTSRSLWRKISRVHRCHNFKTYSLKTRLDWVPNLKERGRERGKAPLGFVAPTDKV